MEGLPSWWFCINCIQYHPMTRFFSQILGSISFQGRFLTVNQTQKRDHSMWRQVKEFRDKLAWKGRNRGRETSETPSDAEPTTDAEAWSEDQRITTNQLQVKRHSGRGKLGTGFEIERLPKPIPAPLKFVSTIAALLRALPVSAPLSSSGKWMKPRQCRLDLRKRTMWSCPFSKRALLD